MDPNYLFADFLENETTYQAAQHTWQELLDRIAAVHGYSLVPYMDLAQSGRPVRDGNPLLAQRVPATGRGVRIIQTDPAADGSDLGAWFDTFAAGESTETAELVIDVKMTPTALAVAAILVEHWLAERLSAEGLARWLGDGREE